MEPPSFPAGGPQVLRATPGSDAGLVFPLPSGSPPFQFEWSRAGAKLSERFTSSQNAGGVRLSISAARTGDSGVYTLQASNAAGKDTTRVLLEVSPDEMPTGDDPPTFLRRLQDLTVKVGTRTRFLVEIVSSTECRVTWYRNERRLMEAERIALVRDGNFWCADISAVSVDDAGRWTCTAENIGGRASCSAHLNVLVPKAYKRPEFVEELRALLTEQGTVSLECKVVGVPTPVLRWFKDSREIKAGDVFALTANAEDPTSLGTYTCEAVNCMGRAYSSSKVQVVGRSSREGSSRPNSGGVMLEPPPIFTKELEDQFVRICERLTLSCQIVVPPWPRTVVWYNKEGKVEPNDKYHILEDGVGGYFIEIQTSEFPDEGEWKCVATSTGGRVGISTCYVSMDIPKNYRKPRFMENLQAVLTEEGLVSFECKVVGFPTPVLSWFKDGQELKPGDVYQLTGTNSLGSYCCIARNFMGQASSSAELTVEDIQNQLNEEEKLQLFSKNQAPKYLQGLKSVEAKIDEPFRFTIKVAIPPEPTVLWYRDEQPVDESSRCHLGNEERGSFFLDIQNLEFMDQAEWKCVAMNDYGQSVTSCFLKLIIPRHYKKPRFLENLQAILSDEGAVNLECKVIGVPQPVLKWYKDGEELKPGDIHRIISGQDGTCCLGTYTCEAQNCMGIAASSASLLGFEDSLKAKNKKKADEQTLQRNLSLSTIHEERTSQMYDTPIGDITLDDKGEISFSFDGKEVSVSLYETPDLTEEEALQIVEMYADQLSENVTEHNVVELPPLRFVKETSTSGNLLMEAIIIDVSPEYFTSPEEDLRTEADIEDISIADENGPPQLSLDQDLSGEDYLEKTMALLSEERANATKKIERKKSDSQKSVDDYFSLSRDRSTSEEKKDDDTQVLSESDLQSFASAHSTEKPKSKSSKPSLEDGQESSDFTKTVLLKEDLKAQITENIKNQRDRRGSRGSRRSTSSEKSPLFIRKELLEIEISKNEQNKMFVENIKIEMMCISSSLTKVMNAIQIIERDIILKSELMSVAATASRSLEVINSLIIPLSEIHSITDTITDTETESPEIIGSLFNRLPQSLGMLEQSLTIVEKCIDYESDNKTLVKKTCVSLIENCGDTLRELITAINRVAYNDYAFINDICTSNIKTTSDNILKTLKSSADASKQDKIFNETKEDKTPYISLESKHLHHTQKVLYALKSSLKSVLSIIEGSDAMFKSIADIKNAEIILDEISTPIQELQNALEQIETLSVAESDSNLPKFNTEIIESVINSVLKLRTAFEQLSTDKENKINEVLMDIKQNIHSISSQLDLFEEKNGKFDILHNENKLEVLQTMAQILISLENSVPILDTIPNLKSNMLHFHKNLTKVLENVIESNDSTKYFSLLEICSAISRINTSLNNMESQQVLSLAIISNTLKIIQRRVHETIFENSLNESVLNNINDLLLDIQESINQVEESTLIIESEKVDDFSIKVNEENKLITVLEQVQKTIASMSKVVFFENVENLTIAQVFENIHPVLTEIQCCVASLNVNTIEHSENVADITISSFTEAIAQPLCELHQNITVLNEVICDIAKNNEITQLAAFAEPLLELQTTLEILQAEVISQYEEIVQCSAILCSIANSVDNLQSCIVKIQEHDVLDVVDDMSTLDDISGIKTTADILLPTDMISSIEDIKIKEFPVIHTNVSEAITAQALQTINKQILSLQESVVAENIKALPDDNDNLPIKSLLLEIESISAIIEDLLQPITMEVSQLLLFNPSKLTSMVQPLEHLQDSLSVVNARNITCSENLEEITQTQHFIENILNLKIDVDAFLNILHMAVETVDVAIDTAAKRVALKQLPEKLEILLSEYIDFPLDKTLKMELTDLREDVVNALNTNLSDNICAEEINEIVEKVNKCISKVQYEGFNCTAHNLNILSHESNLVKTLSEMEQCIATLEECNLPGEFAILTPETDDQIAQVASDTDVGPLIHLDQITRTVVNAICNKTNDVSENDLKLTEDFVDTFSKEITLLRYLLKNRPSPKQIIKSIQVFYALLSNLNDYKSRFHNTLSDDFNSCLKASLNDMEICLNNIKTILIKIIHSQSELLFEIPQRKMNNGEQFLKNILQSKNDMLLHTTCSVILNFIEISKPINDTLKDKMIKELTTYEHMISQQDDADFNDNYDNLACFLTAQAKSSLEKPLNEIAEKLLHVIKKHEDVKDVLGIGRRIIFIQCISDCIDLLKQFSVEYKLKDSVEKCITKEININELLLEIAEPLDCFNTQIINIRNKIILASENDIDMNEIKALESHVNVISGVNENIILSMSNNGLSLDNNDVALVIELNNKINLIHNNLKTLESTPISETIKLVVNPLEEIEKNLHLIISYNKDLIDKKSQSNKEKAEALLLQMEQHIEIIEIVEEVSAIIKLDDLKNTASIVRELRGSIVGAESAIDSGVEECSSITTDQIPLTDKLQKALISLQSQALGSAQQDTVNVKEDIRQQIIEAVSDLQNNLIQLTNISLENQLENVNNVQTAIVEEKDNQISDKPSDEIIKHDDVKCELIESDQIKQNAFNVPEQTLNLSEINDDLVPDEKLLQGLDVKELKVEENSESKYNLSSNETSEDLYASNSLIDSLLENIQEYLRQDITDITKQFASCLNHEAVKITYDISQQFCQASELSKSVLNDSTGSLIMSDEQLEILSDLQKNVKSIFIYEPATELQEVFVEDKLIQFKHVAMNLCEAIQNLNISTITTIKADKSEELESKEFKEPKIEVDGSLSDNQMFCCNDVVAKSNDTTDNLTDNEIIITQNDSKSEDTIINKNIDVNVKEDLGLGAPEENLVHSISEYVKEEVTEILKQILSVLNTEHLEKSHEIANQLFTLCEVTSFDEANTCNLLKEKLELTVQLNESIMLIRNEVFDETNILPALFEKDKLTKIQCVLNNLSDTLGTYITFEHHIPIEQVIELDKSQQELNVESIVRTEQNVDEVDKTEETADLVYKIEELKVLSAVNKEDDEKITPKISKCKSEDYLNNKIIEGEHLVETDHENEINSIQKLNKLLQEVNDSIDLSLTNDEYSEIIQNNLDEVQLVIMKLKYDFDGTVNDALNETLEDLECNVRSVQLQVNEQSPPELLKEACLNLLVIVTSLNNIEEVKKTVLVSKINTVIDNCSEDADQTIQLLNKACCLEKNSKLDIIISRLNNVKDKMKSLRTSFVGDAETLILKGTDVIQNLDQIEDTIFLLEKDVDIINDIDVNVKDEIITAMHSVYGSISNMRGAISSIQKRYMYENYGKPSQNFLKSIKNIADISQLSVDNKLIWKKCGKCFRKVLNHFEDIKFYINFDRTARIPNDAAFTKIILRETIVVLNEATKLHDTNCDVRKTIADLSNYVNNKNLEIEERTTLEVKEKIPIFIDISNKILEATEVIKLQLQDNIEDVSDSKLIQADDNEQNTLTDLSRVIIPGEEVQETLDLNLGCTELVTLYDKENKELFKVATEAENMLQEASKLECISVVQNVIHLQEYQKNDNEQTGADTDQVRIEEILKEVEIMKMPSEDLKESDNVETEKSVQMQEGINQTSSKTQSVDVLSPLSDFSNLVAMENDTTEEQNMLTREEIRSSQQVSETLIKIDKCEVLMTNAGDNVKAEASTSTSSLTLKRQEENNETDSQEKENQPSNILKEITLESDTGRELAEELTTHAIINKNTQLNEDKGKVNIIENFVQAGLLSNNNSDVDDKVSIIEDHHHQATDTNIETNLDVQEKETITETEQVEVTEIKKNKICKQLQQNILLVNEENDDNSQIPKDYTSEYNQSLNLFEQTAISEKLSSAIITNKDKSEEVTQQNQVIDIEQKVDLYEDIVNKEKTFLPKKEKNIQDIEEIAYSDLNNVAEKDDDVMDPKYLYKKGVVENVDKQEVLLNETTELTLQDNNVICIINETTVTDSKFAERLNAETGLGLVLNDADESLIIKEEESRTVNINRFKEQAVSKELSVDTDTQKEGDILQKDRNITIKDPQDSTKSINTNQADTKDEKLEKVTESMKYDTGNEEYFDHTEIVVNDESHLLQENINELMVNEVIPSSIKENIESNEDISMKYDTGNEEYFDHNEIVVNEESHLLQENINELMGNEVIPSSITENIESNEDIKKSAEQHTVLVSGIIQIDHSEIVVNDESHLLQDNINELMVNEVIPSSITEIEANENIKKSAEQHTVLVLGITETPLENLKTDLKKEREDTKSYSLGHEKAAVNNSAGNDKLNSIKDMDVNQIEKPDHSDIVKSDFKANARLKEEYANDEQKATVTKLSEEDHKKHYQEIIILKENDIIKDNENQEESVKCNLSKSDSHIVWIESKEKQNLDVNMLPKSERIEDTEVKPENIAVVDAKSYKSDNEVLLKKNDQKQLVNITENNRMNQIKDQEQPDNKDSTFTADSKVKKVRKKPSESNEEAMVAEILQKEDKKFDQESITLRKDVIDKNKEESLKCYESEPDNKIVLSEFIEIDIQKPSMNVESNLENKEATEVKPKNKGVIDETEEIESVKILKDADIYIINQQEQSEDKDSNFPVDTRENEEHLGSEPKPVVTVILDKDDKKDDQISTTMKKDVINNDDKILICEEKQGEAVQCNQPESEKQIVFIESIEKLDINVQPDIEKKETIEDKPENKQMIDAMSNSGGKKDPVKKNAENELVIILERADIHKITEKEQPDNKEANFPADKKVGKENSEFEARVIKTEILNTDHEKNNREKLSSKKDVLIKGDESSNYKENQKESVQFMNTEAEIPIVSSENIEKDKQGPDANVLSGLENKEVAEPYSFDKNTIVQQNIKLINILEGTDVHETKIHELYDKNEVEVNFTDKLFKEKYLDSESKDMDVSKDNKNDDQKCTLVNDVIDKKYKDTIFKVKTEESMECHKTESDNEKDSLPGTMALDLDILEPKNNKHYLGDEKVPLVDEKKSEENDLVNNIRVTGFHQIEDQEQSYKNEENLILDTILTPKHLESSQKSTFTNINKSKKDNQESLQSNENDKNELNENLICKETLEESMEYNKTEPDDQIMSNELISKGHMKLHGNLQLDLKNKQEEEVKSHHGDEITKVDTMEDIELVKKVVFTEIKDQQKRFNKKEDDNNVNIIDDKKLIQLDTNDVISNLSDEACRTEYQENITSHQDDTSIGQDIVKYRESSLNIISNSEKEQTEEVVIDAKPVKNDEGVEKVGVVKKVDEEQLKELGKPNNKKEDYAIDTFVEEKYIDLEKKPVVIELENSTSTLKSSPNSQGKDISSVEISELEAEVKNQNVTEIMDENIKNENENIALKKDSFNKGGKDSTPTCKQKETDFDYTDVIAQNKDNRDISRIENNLPIVNDPNDSIKETKSKTLEKNKDVEHSTDKKSDEINIKQQEKNKKNGKKKPKQDKKKTHEESKEHNGKNNHIEVKPIIKEKDILTKDTNNKLYEKSPKQVAIDHEQSYVTDTREHTFSTEEYRSKPTEQKEYSAEDIKSGTRDIPYSITTNTNEYITNTEENENREYLVSRKSSGVNYERTEFERKKYHPKDSPIFIDHDKTDYTLQFPRPPNYTPKSFDNEELISSELNIPNRPPIHSYKAQTLMHDYQTRLSISPNNDPIDQRLNSYSERALARSRSKALSESRSITSEKRNTRDLKRKPVFSTFLTDRTAVESSRVKLTCSILSSSDPTITWYKNGTLLEDKQKFRSKFVDGLITLEVLNAIPNDSGEYSCTVGNEYGSITSSANLKVYPSFEASPIPPTFTRSIRDVYHSLENELVLECRIRGQPLPSITWYKDDKPITQCERYQAHYLADGVCRLTVTSPTKEDSGKYTCHAESSIWSDQIYHNVQFTEKECCVSPNIFTLEKVRLNRQVMESRKPHFTNVISDYKVVSGGTIGLQVEIKGSPTRVEWLREGSSVTDTYRNAQTYVDHGIYTLALSDVTEKESGLYTCRAWSSHGNVDMNASIIVVQPNQIDGKPAVIVSRPTKDILISVGEDINISFRVQGEPKAKVIFMKGLRDITHSQRVCKMTSDDYIKFTMKRSVVSDAGTYCILARNAYGCDRAFVTVVIRQRASSENLVSDWTYPMDDLAISALDRNYKAVPDRIPSEPSVVDGGKNWVSLAWPKPDCQSKAPILAYKVESWLIGKEGGARWAELGITPRNSFDAFNLKQEEEYHFRVTPRNRYGWGESVQTTSPVGIGLTGDRPDFIEILPGQLKVLVGETATLCCTFKGKPTPEILWMKNGHDVDEDSNRVRITLNSYEACLNIENVKVEDEGRYSCEASNIHGRSSTYARMTVITDRSIWEADAKLKRERSLGVEGEFPPQFTMRLRDRRVQATYPVRLTCQVIGGPAPVLTWFKNGEQVTADVRHNMSQDEYFYTLEIAPTTLDDGGVYEAMARNSSGAISCRCSLVVDKGIRAYVAPEFCCGLEPLYQLREGEELRISAIVEAYPSVGVSWYRDGVRLRPSRRAIMTLDRDGQIELALAFITGRDAGVYTCTASNEVGRVSTSGKVEILGESSIENVHAPPIFVSDESSSSLYSNEPRFLRKPRSSEAREGDTVIIECEVIGDPKPEVYWLRDFLKPDYYRDANHFKRVGAGPEYRFEIPHAKFDYTGAYSVIAKNIHGEAKAIISLQILARDPNSSQDAHNIRYGRVEVIPRFEKELTDLLCYDGDAIEFECRVSANPEPDIRWFHYSEMVPESPDFESSYDRGTARLKIKQVTAEDEGTFRCEASNSLGKTTSSACLVVYPPGEPNTLSQRLRRPPALLSGASTPRSTPRTTPRNTPRTTPARSLSATPGPDSRRLCSPCREISPKFYTYPFNRVAEEGDTVVFQCAVKGLPPPWATWDKDGIIITASSRITIKEKDEMFRILEIAEVNVEDVGLYRITLENDYGRAEASARLEVISGKGKFHGTRSYSASPSRRTLTYRRRTPSFSRQD